uniref:Uncharacterized protein n=1 Tax=Corethron hystrix TaxID=216773 RepID=A0A7S1G255_9STRA|mmetsp:Transcript_7626/g.16545  ORF Transcript_7626/g.16545 Transcript_7626/m.16545 type:complete len:284 (+) Transcript_7626:138-989(+)|eukprot:CAMPEP_0113314978 /NCGR_PEP_ID=MMETSP0010_2-20120614/10823_1 /TAXON_ID=216773 ORGANISM="Corethron hystrix, Strain 308" /NCGR_SAMPLE_ID=MMETSP0010_2 /ASSEMBLY_ACC=CAM_ASM_000155 /LENGTH=283 /DNA_ID=CAMNT_0000171373 /DNA_START=25 /DNA_END=876 /DNA_ORIENTATION=- /assembly_acc=CAM_ASM_000155
MPPKQQKKKGRPPAHQNSFAFRHNPKSKLTEKILSSPNVGCCRRCHDKIEWRKKYRKYKPLTKPGFCNRCKRRNVKAAYHTICTQCTWIVEKDDVDIIGKDTTSTTMKTEKKKPVRLCAVCACVLNEQEENPASGEKDLVDAMKGTEMLSLRKRKTLERKLARGEHADDRKGVNSHETDEETDVDESIGEVSGRGKIEDMEGKEDSQSASSVVTEEEAFSEQAKDDTNGNNDDNNVCIDGEDDPFLKLIGGEANLLVGDAYRAKMLQQQQQQHAEEVRLGKNH